MKRYTQVDGSSAVSVTLSSVASSSQLSCTEPERAALTVPAQNAPPVMLNLPAPS